MHVAAITHCTLSQDMLWAIPITSIRSPSSLGITPASSARPAEEAIGAMFASVLGNRPIGKHDNFFDAGGNSLMAMQIVARIEQGFGIDIPVATMFDRPTVAGMAQYVRERLLDRAREPLVDPAHEL